MAKFKVYGRMRVDIDFEEIVEAESEEFAVLIAEQRVYAKVGINEHSVLDDEVYCDEI